MAAPVAPGPHQPGDLRGRPWAGGAGHATMRGTPVVC